MNQQLKQLYEKLVGYWKQLEQRQKRNLLLVAAFFVLTVALLSWFALRPNYVVAFANQTPASLGAISQKLDELKIPQQDTEDSISVPEQYKAQAHMKIAMAGLPDTQSGGYGVFDQSSLGMTQDEFNVRYKQAIESNIQDDIQTLQGVHQAKVNIVMPEKPLFVTDNTSDGAKASVVVLLDSGVKLTNDQVTGIQQLVSHSVEGLQPANVSIVDQNGVRLVDDSGDAIASGVDGQTTKQQQIQNQVETSVTNKIPDALERLVGLNNVNVVVHADINFDQTTWTDKTLTPPIKGSKTGAVISSQSSSEDTQGSQGTNAPVGTTQNDPNIPTYNGATSGSNTSSKKSNTTNYDWNTSTVQGQSAPYKIQGYTVSVLVNNNGTKLDAQQKADISKFVSTAIGEQTNTPYANKITVTEGKFQAPANPFTSTAFYKQPWFFGALAAALVLLGGGVFFASRRRKTVEEVEMPAPPRREETPLVIEETENQKMKKQLEKLASQKPEDFVNLLRTWLVEE